MLAPERIESQTEENLVNTKKYADELGCLIKLHAAQGLQEYNLLYAKYKKTPVRYLYDLGFLGKNVGIPHAHYTTGSSYIEGEGDDLALLKESGTTVIHCPLIIGKHSHALESFAKYRKRGINVALGTDTFPTDFFQIFRQGSALSKYINRDLDGSFYSDFFNAATLAGAKFLGRDDLGRLEVGAKADIIVIDLDGFHMGPIADPIRTMILSGSGRDVIMSIINGRIVMKDREIPGVDLKEVKERGQRHFDKLITGYAERDYRQLPSEELFKPSFEIVVNREVK
jgi:cytosine/adenosine deaminase-related metal-dependent hydrolase